MLLKHMMSVNKTHLKCFINEEFLYSIPFIDLIFIFIRPIKIDQLLYLMYSLFLFTSLFIFNVSYFFSKSILRYLLKGKIGKKKFNALTIITSIF